MLATIKSIISIVNAIVLTIFPGLTLQDVIDTTKECCKYTVETAKELTIFEEMYDDCLLNASIVSDIHIDVDWPIVEWVWTNGLNDLERSRDTIDALIV